MSGETKSTKLPQDGMEAILFTAGRMVKMIQEARADTLVIVQARKIAAISTAGRDLKGEERTLQQLRGIHTWCRGNFEYVLDPAGVELIQTPNRMLRELEIPEMLHNAIWDKVESKLGGKKPPPKMTGDADEATVISLALAAAIGIEPLRIRLGGSEGNIYTCWGAAQVGGKWVDFDVLCEEFGSHPGKEVVIRDIDIPM